MVVWMCLTFSSFTGLCLSLWKGHSVEMRYQLNSIQVQPCFCMQVANSFLSLCMGPVYGPMYALSHMAVFKSCASSAFYASLCALQQYNRRRVRASSGQAKCLVDKALGLSSRLTQERVLIHVHFTACFCSLKNRYYVLYTSLMAMALPVKFCFLLDSIINITFIYYCQPDVEVQRWFYVLASLYYCGSKKKLWNKWE